MLDRTWRDTTVLQFWFPLALVKYTKDNLKSQPSSVVLFAWGLYHTTYSVYPLRVSRAIFDRSSEAQLARARPTAQLPSLQQGSVTVPWPSIWYRAFQAQFKRFKSLQVISRAFQEVSRDIIHFKSFKSMFQEGQIAQDLIVFCRTLHDSSLGVRLVARQNPRDGHFECGKEQCQHKTTTCKNWCFHMLHNGLCLS